MTYNELLKETEIKKQKAIKDINKSLRGPMGFLIRADIENNPGKIAWSFLAREFCETLAEHLDEISESVNERDRFDICRIYMAYEDDDEDLYELLPIEAQLFT